jgi:peptidyl-Asp metalloendopeptidase
MRAAHTAPNIISQGELAMGREPNNRLNPNDELKRGESLISENGKYELAQQHDGNLVLTKLSDHSKPWSSWKDGGGKGGMRTVMQGKDGNLVQYDSGNHGVWSSKTAGKKGAWVKLQDDGNCVIYTPIWSTGTAQK